MAGKIWFITGCATGFGRAMAEHALAAGDRVAVTDRDVANISALGEQYPDTALALQLDVTRNDEIESSLSAAIDHFGQIDVLVNNAGYGMQAAVEETDMSAARRMFDVNFFGMVEMIRAALPQLRKQRKGHILNFASVGGRVSGPLLALYSASKYAVEGMSEGLAQEVGPLGIKVTIVEPGAFATNFGASAAVASGQLEDYQPIRDQMAALIGGLAMGNAADLAAAIHEMTQSDTPPLRFVGGADAYGMIEANLKSQLDEMSAWRDLSATANTAALQAG